VKVAKFVETSVLSCAEARAGSRSTIEAMTALVSPRRPTSSEPDPRSSAWSSTPSTRPALRLAQRLERDPGRAARCGCQGHRLGG
jgi:hypothetical protein